MVVATDHYAIRTSGPIEIAGLDLVHDRAGIGLVVGRLVDAYASLTTAVVDIVAGVFSLLVVGTNLIASLVEVLPGP